MVHSPQGARRDQDGPEAQPGAEEGQAQMVQRPKHEAKEGQTQMVQRPRVGPRERLTIEGPRGLGRA